MSKAGETLDLICWNNYGATAGVLEQVLKVNPGVEDYGAKLPIGLSIELPDIDVTEIAPENEQSIKLWD